ncbi:MAG: M15 family metallopeptidase [Actinomycetia bacterium]|nr:M15 family metallopeptidase [Actinomycetes bacterium]
MTVAAAGVAVTTAPVATVSAADAPWTLPTVPPRCSSEQANSGDVAGCILSADSGLPENRGWPTPPFPGEAGGGFPGTGWRYNGSSYNGSPALAEWEATFVSNPTQIGSVRPGQFSTQPDALPLYIGFLTEIQARGYVIHNGTGAYSFRCTASTRKDCRGLTRNSLSNHAYGLAADINVSQNPMQTQTGINGASSCQTPIKTDMPQWVIQTAEKWGLYWGGYGWSGGCSSPDEFKTSSSRDPMHFEFNGTVEQAGAILCHNLGYPSKFEVVTAGGKIEKRCFGNTVPPAGTRMVIHTNAPAGATAALVNVTGLSSSEQGYFTAEPCYFSTGYTLSAWSNGNVRPGRATAGTTVVALDEQKRFCVYQSTAMHSIVDVLGFFAPSASAPDGSLYTPVTPVRTTDSRNWPYCTPENNCSTLGPIAANTEVSNTAVSPVDAVATVANITVVSPTTAGFLTADDCTSLPAGSPHSNVNFAPGDVVANLTLSPSESTANGEQLCTYSQSSTHELIDVQGFFAPAALGGLGYNSLQPSRLVDTRQCWTDQVTLVSRCEQLNGAGEIIHMKAPAGAKAVVLNITTVSAALTGSFVSAGPCSVITAGLPPFSNVNPVVGTAVANAAIVPVDPDGTFCVYTSHTMHVLVDLMGTFNTTGSRFIAVTPLRVHDSRAIG